MRFFKKVKVTIGKPLTPETLGLENGSPKEFRNASRLVMEKIKELRDQQ